VTNPPKLLLALAASSAVLLAGCAAGGTSSNVLPPNAQIYYFRGFERIDKDYLYRYACADPDLRLECSCMSRLSPTCDCRC
jgi:hypothetical protein